MSNGIDNDPVQALLAQTSLKNTLFTSTSRYYGIDTTTLALPRGRSIVYLLRRFVPPPERFQLLQEHSVVQGTGWTISRASTGRPDAFLAFVRRQPRHASRGIATVGRVLRITLRGHQRKLAMNRGFYLTLMMGGFNASPVPAVIDDSLR
jgi:hypothetical protein